MTHVLKSSVQSTLSPIARILLSNKVRVIMYHRFGGNGQPGRLSKSVFETQCIYFRKHFNIITLSQFADYIHSQKTIPSHTLVITIDDGYDDLYAYAYPVLKDYEIPATIYITTGFVDERIWLWPDKIRYIFNATQYKKYRFLFKNQDIIFDLKSNKDKDHTWDWITTLCLHISYEDIQELIAQLSYDLKVDIPLSPTEGYQAVTWENIKEMSDNGIEFGSHTHSHPILSKLNSEDKKREIENSKNILENILQQPVKSFCYPNGQITDFDDETVNYVKMSGYQNATVAYRGLNDLRTDPFYIKRLTLSDNVHEMIHKLNGVEYLGDLIKGYVRKR